MEDLCYDLIKRYENAKSLRMGMWDTQFQEIKELVYPNSSDFTRKRMAGAKLTDYIYDATAVMALDQFASGMHAYTASPSERWFNTAVRDNSLQENEQVLQYLEDVSDYLYALYCLPEVNLIQAIHQVFQSLGSLGTGIIYQGWNEKLSIPHFRCFPLASCWITEDEKGMVDGVFRMIEYTTRQVRQRFGSDALPRNIQENKDLDKLWKFLHVVVPREDIDPDDYSAKGFPYGSYWIALDAKECVEESGFKSFPYHVPRWEQLVGEVYGRSPAMNCLPDIKMLQKMAKVTIVGAEKLIDPPMQLPHDGFLTPLDMTPGAINYRESNAEKAEPLMTGGNPGLGDKLMEQRQEAIKQAFYTDMMNLRWKNERQTATEINERRDDQLRNIAPMLGRLQSELFSPMIQRTYNLLLEHDMLPPHPTALAGKKLYIEYISTAALAQRGSKLNDLKSFITQDFIPMMQVDQTVADMVDTAQVVRESGFMRNVTRKIFRTPDAIAAIRKNRAQQQQQAAAVQQAESASAALKNVGQAAQAAPQLVGS